MKTVCAFGDSVLKGIVLDENHKKYKITPNNFSNLCKNTLGIQIDNRGKFGSTIKNGEISFERYLDKLKDYYYIIFEFGGNDCDFNWKEISAKPAQEHTPNNTISEFHMIYNKMIRKAKELSIHPVLLSLPPVDAKAYFNTISKGLNSEHIKKWMKDDINFITNWHEMYNLEVFKIAIENQVPVIDITSEFLKQKNYKDFLCEDGIHPNEQGHRLIASSIQNYITNKFHSVEDWKSKELKIAK